MLDLVALYRWLRTAARHETDARADVLFICIINKARFNRAGEQPASNNGVCTIFIPPSVPRDALLFLRVKVIEKVAVVAR